MEGQEGKWCLGGRGGVGSEAELVYSASSSRV